MKPSHILLLLGLMTLSLIKAQPPTSLAHPGKNVLYDSFNRIILDETGKKINYPENITKNLSPVDARKSESLINSPGITGQTGCGPEWKFAIMSNYIGRKSMQSIDLDQDEKIEILCSAKGYYNNDFYGDYWYTLEYDPLKQTYTQDYISRNYPASITRMKVLDLGSDGNHEIITGFLYGDVLIIDAITKAEITSIQLPVSEDVKDIELGDADNDGFQELAISTTNSIFLYNPVTYSLKSTLQAGAAEFSIGNVDDDPDNEILTTKGKVLSYKNSNLTTEWSFATFSSDNNLMLEISDIDSDGKKELVMGLSWDYIDVYDVESKSLKFEINTDLDIQALLLADVNNDNIDEILYGDGQWGEIHCINSVTNTEMWYVHNPEHGVTALSVADVDHDGTLEVMWGAGWTSTGADYLFVAGTDTHTIEWQSTAIDGPFYALALDDVDNDGTQELVAVSYESESGYGSGMLLIFNAITHELEWQSDGNFFQWVWTGIYDVAIANVDNDSQKEIIVAAGQTYTAEIWIVDGLSKEIESSHLFSSENLSEFSSLEVADVDDDGSPEIVASNTYNYFVIDPTSYAIEYTSGSFTSSYNHPNIRIGNINSNAEKEIVLIAGMQLAAFGSISHTQWKSTASGYTCVELFDYNADGILEIIAGNQDGTIEVIDGITFQTIHSFQPVNSRIDGVYLTDLGGSNAKEFIFTSVGMVHIYSSPDQYLFTQRFDGIVGQYNSLLISDLDMNGKKEIYVGTSTSILEVNEACYSCTWLRMNKSVSHVSCGVVNDGFIQVTALDGTSPYSYSWSNGTTQPQVSNLSPGSYTVTITDATGCKITDITEVKQSRLKAHYSSSDLTCIPSHDGTASVNITEGTPPYTFIWNTGENTSSLSGLEEGTYSVKVTDSKSCSDSNTFFIQTETLNTYFDVDHPQCYSMNDGFIEVRVSDGTAPFTYLWNNGSTNSEIYNLSPGIYSVTVSDAHGCTSTDSTIIVSPPQILSYTQSTPDDPLTAFGEGTASVNVVGGIPPYTIEWNDPFQQTGITAINLISGPYQVTIQDLAGCYKFDLAFVEDVNGASEIPGRGKIELFPNPTSGEIVIESKEELLTRINIQVFDIQGKLVLQNSNPNLNSKKILFNLESLETGIYLVKVQANEQCEKYTLIISK